MPVESSDNPTKKVIKDVEDPHQYIKILQLKKQSFEEISKFKESDIVCWKTGMKNRTAPEYYQPGIVMKVLSSPITDSDADPFSTYFTEILDLQVGFSTSDNGFMIFMLDSRRLEIYDIEEAKAMKGVL